MNFGIWGILGIVTVVLLIIFWNSRGTVWGGFTMGITLGFLVASFLAFTGHGFSWSLIWKFSIVTTILGFLSELIEILPIFMRKK